MLAWQKSRELVREVYQAVKGCNDYGFEDQIQRASVSVMSNIAEGFEPGTKQEFLIIYPKLIVSFINGLKSSKFQGLQYKKSERKEDGWLEEYRLRT